ncbi:HesB/YadR/YfhF family protein [Bacillus carboniphilus]|uniref:HesB/YadR/YfhF family protein n=1 Tax=Bacillus carboniphilus TaxID=86663 RepID=A0ABN0VQX9_9BACI
MKLQLDQAAFEWYKNEMHLEKGDAVRLFVRYGGCSTVQSGFSLGVMKEQPIDIGVATEVDGVTFYIEEKDIWYLDDHSLRITLNETYNEPSFDFYKES